MIGYYISAWCYIQEKCYCYGFSVRASNEEEARQKVFKKFDRFMRKWMSDDIDREPNFHIDTQIHETHYR